VWLYHPVFRLPSLRWESSYVVPSERIRMNAHTQNKKYIIINKISRISKVFQLCCKKLYSHPLMFQLNEKVIKEKEQKVAAKWFGTSPFFSTGSHGWLSSVSDCNQKKKFRYLSVACTDPFPKSPLEIRPAMWKKIIIFWSKERTREKNF
jgi:hypothetical protein